MNEGCSICCNPKVYFSVIDSELVGTMEVMDVDFDIIDFSIKAYCKECYQEYGGEDATGKGNSSDSYDSESGT